MQLVGYYKRFIIKFSNIDHPITSLQRKGKKFEWIVECVASFEQLKLLLTNAPVSIIVDPYKDFVIFTDACKEWFGGFLMQVEVARWSGGCGGR